MKKTLWILSTAIGLGASGAIATAQVKLLAGDTHQDSRAQRAFKFYKPAALTKAIDEATFLASVGLGPRSTVQQASADLASLDANRLFTKAIEQYARNGLFFYELDYVNKGLKTIGGPEKEANISDYHVITPSTLGLGVKSVLVLRDMEYDSHEKGANAATDPTAAKLAAKEHDAKLEYAYDTLHVLAVPGNRLHGKVKSIVDKLTPGGSMTITGATDVGVGIRQLLLEIFKTKVKPANHKVLKGPYYNEKAAWKGQKPEEEWGAGILAPSEAVVYKDAVSLFDMNSYADPAQELYLLFYADDSGKWRLMQSDDPLGDRDDVFGVFKVDLNQMKTMGSKTVLVQARVPGQDTIDIVIVLETVDTTKF